MVAIKDMEMPSDCYDCPFAKNKRTNDYGSFCECGILEDYETINLYEHSKHPNCPLVEIGTCKDCKHWKDSDGVYHRGVGAESNCPINIKEVYEGTFYCKGFEKRGGEND